MNTPPLLLGAAILFWGWQTDFWLVAVPIAAIVEAHRITALRWEFTLAQLNRISDFCTVFMLLPGAYFYFAVGNPRAIILMFVWMPLILLPLVLAQAYGTRSEFDLSVMFWSLRKYPPRRMPRVNLGYSYFMLWIVAASAANNRGALFYGGLVVFAGWALWAARPRGGSPARWGALFACAVLLGYGGNTGLSALQSWIEVAVPEWLNLAGARTNPYRSTTDIGHIGELKQSERILLRVISASPAAGPLLLHRASYDAYDAGNWIARNGAFATVDAAAGSTWFLQSGQGAAELTIFDYTLAPNPVLSLPAGAAQIVIPGVIELRVNALGTVQVERAPGFFDYRVTYDPGHPRDGAPIDLDKRVPRAEQKVFNDVAASIGIRDMDPEQALDKVKAYFAENFAYATYLKPPAGSHTPLAEFLLDTHKGHCEYFASATVLLLRTAGIPARYATGFSVQEFSTLEDAYIVRERHAHAWAKAYVNGGWRDVDTTPPVWFAAEGADSPLWAPLTDLWSWARFRFARRMATASADQLVVGIVWLAIPALLWIAWRLYRSRRVAGRHASGDSALTDEFRPGADSEFYLVEHRLGTLGWVRKNGETPAAWLARLRSALPAAVDGDTLMRIAMLHYRYRFDPAGLPSPERDRLRSMARLWLQQHQGLREHYSGAGDEGYRIS